jgi:hypothetical protein
VGNWFKVLISRLQILLFVLIKWGGGDENSYFAYSLEFMLQKKIICSIFDYRWVVTQKALARNYESDTAKSKWWMVEYFWKFHAEVI